MARRDFDKAKWLAEKEAKVAQAKEALESGIKALVTSEDWANLLTSMAKAGKLSPLRFSFRNQMILASQRPGCTRVATYERWQGFNRQVRRGEKAAWVLAPVIGKVKKDEGSEDSDTRKLVGFKLLNVFTEDQTDGETIPEPKLADVTSEEAFDGSVEKLREVALAIKDQPVTSITVRDREPNDPTSPNGWYDPRTKAIVVIASGRTRVQQFRTLCHELGHSLLHSSESERCERAQGEVEAESVAFVVCHALGIDSGVYSFPYVATWAGRKAGETMQTICQAGDRITKASLKILDALAGETEALADAA